MEGHDRSLDSTQKLINIFQPDFFLRQENWLFAFEHFKFSQVHNEYTGSGISVDSDNPRFISRNEKAKWGLDTLFKHSMNSNVSTLPEFSNHRIQVIKLSLEVPIIIVNVYLPSSSLPESDYDESLSLLSTIIATYAVDAAILLAGDWNASLYRGTKRDKKFQSFCQADGLIPAIGTDSTPSYHGYNGSVSKIDYVLAHRDSFEANGVRIEDVKVVKQICKENAHA